MRKQAARWINKRRDQAIRYEEVEGRTFTDLILYLHFLPNFILFLGGPHDFLDGFVTFNELKGNAVKDPEKSMAGDLCVEIAEIANICKGKSWATDDPLGIGDYLFDACRVAQWFVSGDLEQIGGIENNPILCYS